MTIPPVCDIGKHKGKHDNLPSPWQYEQSNMNEKKKPDYSAFRYSTFGGLIAFVGMVLTWVLVYYSPQHVFLWCGVLGIFAIAAMILFLISLIKFGQCLWQIWKQRPKRDLPSDSDREKNQES